MENVIVYLVEYYDSIKDKNDYIIIYMSEDVQVISDMDRQIFNGVYPGETYQGEFSIVTCDKLYVTSKEDLFKHKACPYLEIVGEPYHEI